MAIEFKNIKLQNKRSETEDAVSFILDIPQDYSSAYKYKSGQYITIEADINGEVIRRSYSLCSAPHEKETTFTVKRVEGGRMSNYLIDQTENKGILKVGTPDGKFIVKPDPNLQRDHYFIAAGSGITPVMSMIKTLLEEEPKSVVYLIYGNKTIESTIFHKELKDLQEKFSNQFFVEFSFSKNTSSSGILGGLFGRKNKNLGAFSGRIDKKSLYTFLDKYPSRSSKNEFYICGPAGLITETENTLKLKDVDKKNIYKEYFTLPDSEELGASKSTGGNGLVKVNLNGETFDVQVDEKISVLEAIIELGKNPPYSCTSGACSSCMAKVTSGKVTMDSCFALDDQEVKDGYILTCQAHPDSAEVEIIFE